MKPKNLKLIALLRLFATFFYLPILLIGFILYFISKSIGILAHILLFRLSTANNQIKYFWRIQG